MFRDFYPVIEAAFNFSSQNFTLVHDYADALVCEKFEGLPD